MKEKISEPHYTTIQKLSHDGRGIATINGKTTFIENALPEEEVSFIYTKRHPRFDEGRVLDVIKSGPDRVTPGCQHFTVCGGCSLQHMSNTAQLELKQAILLEQLKHFGNVQPQTILPPITGRQWGYRRKARLGVKYVTKKNAVLVGFREKNGRYLADLQRCEVLIPRVGEILHELKTLLKNLIDFLQIPQIEVAAGDKDVALIFRHLKPLATSDIEQLTQFGQLHNLHIYLQPGNASTTHLLWPTDQAPRLAYTLPDYQLEYLFHPQDFTQINHDVNQLMVKQALTLLAPAEDERILDLFCGLGNFSLAITKYCAHVVGVEGSQDMVQRAYANATHNQLNNVEFHCANLAEDVSRFAWATQTYDKILLDPARTGAKEIIQYFDRFKAKRVVYVSCNPATLARDAGELAKFGYILDQVGVMDMFPHTSHVEAIAVFNKKYK